MKRSSWSKGRSWPIKIILDSPTCIKVLSRANPNVKFSFLKRMTFNDSSTYPTQEQVFDIWKYKIQPSVQYTIRFYFQKESCSKKQAKSNLIMLDLRKIFCRNMLFLQNKFIIRCCFHIWLLFCLFHIARSDFVYRHKIKSKPMNRIINVSSPSKAI